MRVHHLNNVNKALQILEQNNVSIYYYIKKKKKHFSYIQIKWFNAIGNIEFSTFFFVNIDTIINFQVKLVNISSNDIVDGSPKLILGLVWSIILHWQVNLAFIISICIK